jgi:5-methylcytosine-specific restriction endonuclease McrA
MFALSLHNGRNHMTKRTKELSISPKVRKEVYERDSWDGATCCIFCGSPYRIEVAHFIPRSLGGLGIVENLAAGCIDCHKLLDYGFPEQRKEKRTLFRNYLIYRYGESWNEELLKYSNKANT